jgi:hypothetical protein
MLDERPGARAGGPQLTLRGRGRNPGMIHERAFP